MRIKPFVLLLCLVIILTGCSKGDIDGTDTQENITTPETKGAVSDLGDDRKTFGESLGDLGIYDGYFTGDSNDIVIKCVSGTDMAYKYEGNTLTFTEIGEKTVYSISGMLRGNIVIDTGDDNKFDLELNGLSLVCDSINPITVISGDEVAIKAKNGTKNYIYDMRAGIESTDETLYSGAIHSDVDLEISGKGELVVVSENNNGIHSKDDLQVKNLTLNVACLDNSLKGNDSVEIENCNTTLIASVGDCIKTSNSDISEKGNQRGTISIAGGTHNLYAACDGIDAAYNVTVDDNTTVLNIYTDKYSTYSKEVTATSADVNYIRFTDSAYYYSVKYYNSDNDYAWVNAEYHSKVSGGRNNYYYYSYPPKPDYEKVQFYIYETESQLGQEEEYFVKTEYLTQNSAYDTFALTQSFNGLDYQWTNYTTNIQEGGFGGGRPGGGKMGVPEGIGIPGRMGGFDGMGGFGGMGEGNTDKGEYSTKGIKAANEIVINDGTVNIKSYDDAIHANNDTELENSTTPLGNVTINGGNITIYTNDDGLHADGALSVTAGTVSVTNSYEGIEGTTVNISGGYLSVNAKDDGINATATSSTAAIISGGTIYIYCKGDGIDTNSRTPYQGIEFTGGNTVVISDSGGNSAIDTEQGYTYEAGKVIAIMPRGGMSNEAAHCQNFSSIGKSTQISLTKDSYLIAEINGSTATLKMPVSLSALVITLGDSSPDISTESSVTITLDDNGVAWN